MEMQVVVTNEDLIVAANAVNDPIFRGIAMPGDRVRPLSSLCSVSSSRL
jgi:hypothetical protein